MKKVSCRMFFAVLGKGICQAFRWFLGLFGYKREGRFAKVVWGVFSVSASVAMAIIAIMMVYTICEDLYRKYSYRFGLRPKSYWTEYVTKDIEAQYYGNDTYDIVNTHTGETTIQNVRWYGIPDDYRDSLVVYRVGKKRGYFNKHTGRVAISPRFNRAWVFSNGIASVEDDGVIRFIDQNGRPAFDRTFEYRSGDAYVYHEGYCIIDSDNDGLYGLMNTKGETVVPEEYTVIRVQDSVIYVTLTDNTIRSYDLDLNMTCDFYFWDCGHLDYQDQYESTEWAELCYYVAGNSIRGLMTEEGKVVTMPLYESIEALGENSYVCTLPGGYVVVLNGKGERVK